MGPKATNGLRTNSSVAKTGLAPVALSGLEPENEEKKQTERGQGDRGTGVLSRRGKVSNIGTVTRSHGALLPKEALAPGRPNPVGRKA